MFTVAVTTEPTPVDLQTLPDLEARIAARPLTSRDAFDDIDLSDDEIDAFLAAR